MPHVYLVPIQSLLTTALYLVPVLCAWCFYKPSYPFFFMQKSPTVLDTLNINSILLTKISNIATVSIAQTYKQNIQDQRYEEISQGCTAFLIQAQLCSD